MIIACLLIAKIFNASSEAALGKDGSAVKLQTPKHNDLTEIIGCDSDY